MADLTGREKDNQEPAQKPDSDATSKDTLSDVREGEKVSSGSEKPDSGPAPDGSFDEDDELKDAGPM